MNNIFDTHAHYADSAFDVDRDELLKSLPEKGIKYVMLASTDIESSLRNTELSNTYDYIYTAIGIHPEDIAGTPENYIEILDKIIKSNPKVKAIGEIGLDYHYEGYDREKQIQIFREQLEFANSIRYPVIVHSRDATEDTMKLLREYKPRGVMHCFSGSAETAKKIINLGMYISFTGVLTYKNARKAVESLAVIPNDRFMLETDCPYMSPVPLRGKRCDSSMIPYTAEKAGEIKRMTTQEVLDITCRNGIKLFSI
ncbi:MAG: TatD family hydrolase [Ruminococcus sp.]|nr:TatD family hydrolase [Ruminococcus sp.]